MRRRATRARHRSPPPAIVLVAALGAWSVSPSLARADEKVECAAEAERAQALRQAGKLVEARHELVACARESCPEVVRPYCARWLLEVEAAVPSIVLRAEDARGRDLVGVRVLEGGVVLRETTDGKALEIDPGEHRLRFEARSGDTVDQDLVIAQGEKNRTVLVRFASALRADGTADRAPAPEDRAAPLRSSPEPATEAPPSRTAAYVVGAASLLLLGGGVYFDLASWSDYHDLHDGCGATRACSASDVSSVRTKIAISAVALGAGVIGAGAAAWLYLSAPSRAGGVGVRAALGVGGASLAGSF